jgi:hypothetical protein
VLRKLREARDAAGVRLGGSDRHLVLIRNGTQGWTGDTTKREVSELERTGGRCVEVSDDDLRTFSALKEMLSAQTHQLLAWLVARKPSSGTTFLREILPDPAHARTSHQETRPPPAQVSPQLSPGEIVLGMEGEIRIELESLRKHAIVFAGSGSGKTVLLRRIVEECALRGVSAIVLDPNNDLSQFVDVLAELPEGVSKLSTAVTTAADLAETLRAATVNDPLLVGSEETTDVATLLTPTSGKRARISVISFVGLPSEEQRQGFVSQLQFEVSAWIKRNPAVDRPLRGLFVMDEAQTIAPSATATASTQGTILLASQARKYGLGLLLATQAPKGVHNQVVGNATTQFFGRLNSPAQIAAATEMARAKGSSVGDISRLERGQFYVTGDTFGFRRMRVPLCLSYHPPSPLRVEEVLDRARDGRPH